MLESYKKKVVEIAKKASSIGLCLDGSGNFSMRDPETGYIAITPSKIARDELSYRDIVIVDIDAQIIERKSDVLPTSEILVHLEAYKTRPDVHGVAHTHSAFATSFAIAGKEIPGVVYEALAYGGKVPLAKYAIPGTVELSKTIIEPLKNADACLMEKHGVLAVDKDIDVALTKAIYVEEVAQMYYRSLMISKALNDAQAPQAISDEDFSVWQYPTQVKAVEA
jgi:L-fuculose-phosphate aldolase